MLETHRYRLTVLTPLHIGSGEVLTRLDYVHLGRLLYVLDPGKLGQILAQRNLLASFLREVETQGRNFSLASFMQNHKLHQESLYREIARYHLESSSAPPELHAFIRNAQGLPYLPGSSVKGAFRIAVVYRLLKEAPEEQRQKLLIRPVEQKLQELEQARRRGHRGYRKLKNDLRRHFARRIGIDQKLLQNFRLSRARIGPNTDLLRIWRVGDSGSFNLQDLRVYHVQLLKVSGSTSSSFRRPLAVEALKPGSSQNLTFVFNADLWAQFQKQNPRPPSELSWDLYERVLKNPLETLQIFTHDLIVHERNTLRKQEFARALDFPQPPNLRLGWGQGLLSTTLFLLLPESLRRTLRNALFKDEGAQPAPLTRRLADGKLMGFAYLTPL